MEISSIFHNIRRGWTPRTHRHRYKNLRKRKKSTPSDPTMPTWNPRLCEQLTLGNLCSRWGWTPTAPVDRYYLISAFSAPGNTDIQEYRPTNVPRRARIVIQRSLKNTFWLWITILKIFGFFSLSSRMLLCRASVGLGYNTTFLKRGKWSANYLDSRF